MIFVNLFRISALLTFCLVCGQDVVYKTVETDKGSVRGIQRETLVHKRKFYSFKGIPYAKPPVGKLRFKVTIRKFVKQKESNCKITF